jgi:hypothetical protein
MIAILISWLIGIFVFVSFGKVTVRLFDSPNQHRYEWSDIFFLGFAIVGSVLSVISLWFPLTGRTLLGLIAVSVVFLRYDFIKEKRLTLFTTVWHTIKRLPLLYKILIILVFVVLLLYSLPFPLGYDTGLYHIQAMKWMESYPVLPGLGNIHGRFAFNSNALLLHSVFSMQDIFASRIFGLNSLLFFVLFIRIIFKIKETPFISQLALTVVIFILLRYYDTFISSPNTDVIPHILIVYLLLKAFWSPHSLRTTPLLYLLLPVFCLTLKLSQVPICLICLMALIVLIKSRQYKLIFSASFLCCILFVSWCVRNVIISGYPVYPFPAFDWFDVDWKIPVSLVEREKMWILSVARKSQLFVNEDSLSISFITWMKVWLINCFQVSKTAFFILCLAAISPLVILSRIKRQWVENRFLVYFWLIAFSGVLFWAIMAPDVRFGMGFITLTALLPIMMFGNDNGNPPFPIIPPVLLLLSFLFFLKISSDVIKNVSSEAEYPSLLYRPQTFDVKLSPNEYRTHTIGSVTIYVPTDGDQCFDHDIPCSPSYCYSDSLELRGKSIREGFRIKVETSSPHGK